MRWSKSFLTVAAFAAVQAASGQELFRYRDAPATEPGGSWRVEVDLALLASNPSTLELSLPSEEPITFSRTDFELRGPGALLWSGALQEPDDTGRLEPGWSATLTLDGEWLTGILNTPDGPFELRNALDSESGSGHLLVQLEDTGPWCPGGVLHPRELAPGSVTQEVAVSDAATSDINILALYTQKAMEGRGGAAALENEIQAAVDFFGRVMKNNGLAGRGRLVHVEMAPERLWGTKGLDEVLPRLRSDSGVASLRRVVGADIVTIFTGWLEAGGLSNCGLGYLMTRGDNANIMSPWAYNAINSECSSSVLAHEIGHNLGLNHNPEDTGVLPSEAFHNWAFGHRVGGLGSFRTLMSYGGQPRVSYYSTPSVIHEGHAIGIAGERDNARTLVETLPIGARFMGRAMSTKPPAPRNLAVTIESSTSVSLTWTDAASDETAYVIDKKMSGGAYSLAVELPADTESALVDGLRPETTYVFRVRARRDNTYSSSSNQVTITLPPAVEAPQTLAAYTVSQESIRLEWTGDGDEPLTIEARSPAGGYRTMGTVQASTGEVVLLGLAEDMPYTFRLRADGDGGAVAYSPEASATTVGRTGPCVADGEALCLLGSRFEVLVRWRNQRRTDEAGVGSSLPIPTSDQSGLFRFFDAENIELVVKLLDGRALNNAFWSFYGALSDVEYWIIVRDTVRGTTRTYHNRPGDLCGAADTSAFLEPPGALMTGGLMTSRTTGLLPIPMNAPIATSAGLSASEEAGACVPSATVLCLQDNRFAVEVDWSNPRKEGHSGAGQTLPALSTNKSGFFWFFDQGNLELAVKLLDGRALNDRFWFFWGGLSDSEYTLRVLDTETGNEATYHNEPYSLCGGSDISAF